MRLPLHFILVIFLVLGAVVISTYKTQKIPLSKAQETTNTVALPYIVKNFSGTTSTIAVQNLDSAEAMVVLNFRNLDGSDVYQQSISGIKVSGSTTLNLAEIIGMPDNFKGSAVAHSSQKFSVVVKDQNTNIGNEEFAAYRGVDQASYENQVPIFYRNSGGMNSELMILNPSTNEVPGRVDFHPSTGGTAKTETFNLLPGETKIYDAKNLTGLSENLVPAENPVELFIENNPTTFGPTAAYNSNRDEYLIVWMTYGASDINFLNIQRVNRSGQMIGEKITKQLAKVKNPAVVFNPDDKQYLLVYESWLYGDMIGGDVWKILLDEDGNFIGEPHTLFPFYSAESSTKPAIAYNNDNKEYAVVWESRTTTPPGNETSVLKGGRIDRNGNEIQSPVDLGNSNVVTSEENPALAYNSNAKKYFLAFEDFSGTDANLGGVVLGTTLEQLSSRLPLRTNIGVQNYPSLIYDPLAQEGFNFKLAWKESIGSLAGIVIADLNDEGQIKTGSEQVAAKPTNSDAKPCLAFNETSRGYAIFYHDIEGLLSSQFYIKLYDYQFNGNAVVKADQEFYKLAVVGRTKNYAQASNMDSFTYEGVSPSAGANAINFPEFAKNPTDLPTKESSTNLTIKNVGTEATSLKLTVYDPNGTQVMTKDFPPLAVNANHTITAGELNELADGFIGSAVVSCVDNPGAPAGKIIGLAVGTRSPNTITSKRYGAGSYSYYGTSSSTEDKPLSFPLVDFNTAFMLQNSGDSTANTTLKFFNPDGSSKKDLPLTIAPYGRTLFDIASSNDSAFSADYVGSARVENGVNISAIAYSQKSGLGLVAYNAIQSTAQTPIQPVILSLHKGWNYVTWPSYRKNTANSDITNEIDGQCGTGTATGISHRKLGWLESVVNQYTSIIFWVAPGENFFIEATKQCEYQIQI